MGQNFHYKLNSINRILSTTIRFQKLYLKLIIGIVGDIFTILTWS